MAKQTQANPAARRAELQRARPTPTTERGDKNARTTELKTRSSDKKRVGPAARSSPQSDEDANPFRSTPTSRSNAGLQPPHAKPPQGAAQGRCKRRPRSDPKKNQLLPKRTARQSKNRECKSNPHPRPASAHNSQQPCRDARPRHSTLRSPPPGARATTLASPARSATGEGRVHNARALAASLGSATAPRNSRKMPYTSGA